MLKPGPHSFRLATRLLIFFKTNNTLIGHFHLGTKVLI